ncbi:MAG: EAL domain-containing protein [Geminicoccaceae bacterium]|nr:EAL domain-containing protein [Geminicoccaceae bacterium]
MPAEFRRELAALLETTSEAGLLLRGGPSLRPAPEVVAINRKLLELLGQEASAVAGRSLRRLLDPAQPRERLVRLFAAIAAREAFEGSLALASAREGPLEVHARLVHLPGIEDLSVLWFETPGDPVARLVRGLEPWKGLARDGCYLLVVGDDLQLRLVWAEASFYAACGRSEGDPALAGGPTGLARLPDRALVRARLQRLLSGQDSTVEYSIATAAGEIRRVRDSARPVRDAEGTVRMIVGVLGEATEERRSARERSLAERAAGVLARHLHELVCLVDAQGRLLWASAAPATEFADIVRKPLPHAMELVLAPRDHDLWLELVDEALATRESVVGRLTAHTPRARLRIEASLTPISPELVIAVLRPEGLVPPRTEGAAALAPPFEPGAPSGAEAAPAAGPVEAAAPVVGPPVFELALLDAVAVALVGLERGATIGFVNRAAERLFGRDRSALLGRPFEELVIGEEPSTLARLLLEELPRTGAVRELRGRRASGEPVLLEVEARPLAAADVAVLLTLRDATLSRYTEETLRTLAYLDPLTGLPNRLLFNDRLSQAIERARRAGQLLAVMIVDLDRFKLVNDSLGLERGDQLLKAVGERLRGALRRSDTVARLASDRYLVLVTGLAGTDPIVKIAHKLLHALEPPFTVDGHELTVTAGIGIAVFPHDGEDASTLVKNADTALGRAKELGRGHVQFYTNDMNAQAFERLMLENRLRRALENGELVVYYQPQISLRTGRVVGVEALVRWFHPELGLVPPGEFIPLAEETGLILPIGYWAMETACLQVRRWQEELERPDLRLGVNLSARQFQHPELPEKIRAILERTGFPARCLELELTESVVMREAGESQKRMRALTLLGVALAIDDFGTGYSSLAYLRSFPIRSLKIDRSFVQDLDRDPSSATIVQAIVALGVSLGLNVVAEGVETAQQLRLLRRMGCQEMQGFFASRALPADQLLPILRHGRIEGEEFSIADEG